MATTWASSADALKKIQKALGLDGLPLQKVVIEIDLEGCVTVYVKGLVTQEQFDSISDAIQMIRVEKVGVKDDGTVKFQILRELS